MRIVDRIQASDGMDDGADEHTLFSALQTCAFRATATNGRSIEDDSETSIWKIKWVVIRDFLVQKNLGLAYSMMKAYGAKGGDIDEQRSAALYALMRAVEGFDPWRGFRFSTYACNAIARSFLAVAKQASKYRTLFPVEHDSWLEPTPRTDPQMDLRADRLRRALDRNLGELSAREALVLSRRFPMDGGRGLTLREMGNMMGLSKERVRQIQVDALNKLRVVLAGDPALQ